MVRKKIPTTLYLYYFLYLMLPQELAWYQISMQLFTNHILIYNHLYKYCVGNERSTFLIIYIVQPDVDEDHFNRTYLSLLFNHLEDFTK